MNLFRNISEKIGLTQTELKIIFFLFIVFLVGLSVRFFNWENDNPLKNSFDYTTADSIFYSANIPQREIAENKAFDSKLESSDFNESNFNVNIKKQKLAEKSINLNSASLKQLTMLPGIGIKTAEKILAYRNASGGFDNIDELAEVDGIGNVKFNKIKKYIFVR